MRMTRVVALSVALGVGAAVAACHSLEDPASATDSQLVIHAVMDAGTDEQTILVFRARTGTQTSGASSISDDEPVTRATVTVTSPNGVLMTAVDTLQSPGVYVFSPSRYQQVLTRGATYALHVQTREGEAASGATTIPSAPPSLVLTPRPFNRLRDTLRLAWPSVPGARSYQILIRSARTERYRNFSDTSFVLAGTALNVNGDTVFAPGRTTAVSVSAVDLNYYEYYRAQSDPFAGAAPTHLIGAAGVFGSSAPVLSLQLQVSR